MSASGSGERSSVLPSAISNKGVGVGVSTRETIGLADYRLVLFTLTRVTGTSDYSPAAGRVELLTDACASAAQLNTPKKFMHVTLVT